MRTPLGMALGLLLAGAPAAAQQHEHPQPERREQAGMAQQGMHERMPDMPLRPFQPAELLGRKAELSLTDEQVARLERLTADAQAKHEQAMASHEQHRQQLEAALAAETPDPQAVRAHFQGAHDAMGAAHWAQLEAAVEGMALLTAEQRATVRKGAAGCCQQRKN